MHFKPKKIDIKTGNKYVVVFSHKDAVTLDLYAGDRVKIANAKNKNKFLTALVDVSDNNVHQKGVLGIFAETYQKLNFKSTDTVLIDKMEKPVSVEYIKAKLNGKKLTATEIEAIVNDIIEDNFTDTELTYFVSGAYLNGLDDEETANLTKSIVKNGKQIKFSKGKVMDKHCIGGVPGNRTTMLVVPIITAAGLKMPKTSSRSITSPAGTADTMEALANVTIEAPELKKLAEKINGFIAWGGGVDIASADDHLIKVRHPLSLDPEGMMLASIMAKKFAVGSTDVLIDIPFGENVKVKDLKQANHLQKRFEKIGKMLGMNIKVIKTNGEQPIGNGIGPMLEALDVIKVLENKADAPKDLIEKSLQMSGLLLEMGGKCKPKQGYKLAKEILTSGKALAQFNKMVNLQGKSKFKRRVGKFTLDFKAEKSGTIKAIHNKTISLIARTAGAPHDKYAGLYIHKKLSQKVSKGEVLFTAYSDNQESLKEIKKFVTKSPYTIS